jgi:DNA-binding MarR family transcriptional regulator
MDKVTVNRAAKALADRQLIARQAHEADGRSHHLDLTETGRSLYDAIVPAALGSEAQLESNISADERAMLLAHPRETDRRRRRLWLIAPIARRRRVRCASSRWAN